ncbi:hypothetical protein ABZW18_11295 [Streptomyces sp. NPDC004647]|uniref:hypothetical protein n=1 Tax=Streptomyces sp. NPDC004647 TaxID=3154671 RepID=UPI00339DAA8A
MPTARIFATAIAATAVVGLTAPVAVASVNPHWVRPGQTVWISDDRKCDIRRGATAHSDAFGTVRLRPRDNKLVGQARVHRHAKGEYKVTIRCGDGRRLIDSLHVGPTRGSQAGEGGGIAGMNTSELVGGAALVVLAAGGGLLVMRRRAKGRV